jgi:hypothetical protein
MARPSGLTIPNAKRGALAAPLPFDRLRAGFDRAPRTVEEYKRKGREYSLECREGRVGKPAGGVALVERARLHGQRSTSRRHAERAGGGPRVVARRQTDSDIAVWPRKAAEERKKRVPLHYPL